MNRHYLRSLRGILSEAFFEPQCGSKGNEKQRRGRSNLSGSVIPNPVLSLSEGAVRNLRFLVLLAMTLETPVASYGELSSSKENKI
ncbi:MAG TPA: hypothetical protein VI935_04125 [Thermodesulfobacteriota bacterium]|nr:hypothetical protein [Thermodesulfobacteriota bacterium]